MRRGEVWVGNLNPNRGAGAGKIRPVLIVQADFLTRQGHPTVVVLPLTTQIRASLEPLHLTIHPRDRLREACQVMPEQPRTLDRSRLVDGPLATLERDEMDRVERVLLAVLGLS